MIDTILQVDQAFYAAHEQRDLVAMAADVFARVGADWRMVLHQGSPVARH